MSTVVFNGKFVAQPLTGVQRFARELVHALDAVLDSAPDRVSGARFQLALPAQSTRLAPTLRHISHLKTAGHAGHLWEQIVLPFAARGSTLVNFAGGAPAFAAGQVFTMHDAAVFDHPEAYRAPFVAWYRSLFRLQARTARLLVTVSEFSRQRLAARLGVSPQRFHVVPNGSDHILRLDADRNALAKLGLEPQSYLLAVGSANPTKNFPALIDAFRLAKMPSGVRLVIVGGGNDAVFAARPLAADASLVLAGRVSDAALKELYSSALAFVFPSIYEGFGVPPLEAMACGCPVIASDAEAVAETCGDAASYFDGRDPSDIARALETVTHDSDLRSGLKQRGLLRAGCFTWDIAARTLLRHLHSAGIA
jgi:glycosyltransferase involved in cell wall biosynthesis